MAVLVGVRRFVLMGVMWNVDSLVLRLHCRSSCECAWAVGCCVASCRVGASRSSLRLVVVAVVVVSLAFGGVLVMVVSSCVVWSGVSTVMFVD